MDQTGHLELVNAESKERHQLLRSECVIGRGQFNCNDKRISRKHGILKITSNETLSLTSTHQNPIFYKMKNDETIQLLEQHDPPIVLGPGDSFGLIPTGSAYWFEIDKSDMQRNEANGSPVVDKSPGASAAEGEVKKRKLPSWMNGQGSKKMRNDNSAAAASSDGDSTIAFDDKTIETNDSESTLDAQNVPDLPMETPSKESASTMNDANDSKRTRGNETSSTIDNIVDTDLAGSTVNEPNDQMDVPTELAVNESALSTDAVEAAFGGGADIVSNEPNPEANLPPSEVGASEAPEASNAATDSSAPADPPAQLEPATSTADDSDDDGLTVPLPKVQIKAEPMDDIEPSDNDGAAAAGPSGLISVKQEIKKEVKTEPDSSSDAAPKLRDCCPYGARCYRRNPAHRGEMAHPGDTDYRLPSYGDPLPGAPPCPYGLRCYRRNPTHFRQFSHPPSTDPAANRKAMRAKKNANSQKNNQKLDEDDGEDYSDDNDEDPFADDDDEDDPDFLGGDLSTDDDDEESGKDSGHESIEPDTEAD